MFVTRHCIRACMAAAALFASASATRADVTFIRLGFLPEGYTSYANGVSSAGAVVVGSADFEWGTVNGAFRWTTVGGMQLLFDGTANAVSADGSLVVGDREGQAYRWTEAGGLEYLGTLPGGTWSNGWGVSADGSVVVGAGNGTGFTQHAYRWTAVSGMVDLGTMLGGNMSYASGVSGDGSVVVGWSTTNAGGFRAFRWTEPGGMVDLGTLPGGVHAEAFDANSDGSVVVGRSNTAGAGSAFHAFRWTAAEGMQDLGALYEGFSRALGVSDDGMAVVGNLGADVNPRAFLWTPSLGTVDLNVWLPAQGVNLGGAVLKQTTAISPDGTAIVGYGTYFNEWAGWWVDGAWLVLGILATGVPDAGAAAPAAAAAVQLLPASPNPFAAGTALRFVLAAEADMRLVLHDVAGRHVATLLDGRCAAGTHVVGWDGRTNAGQRAAAGIYLARLESGGVIETRKVVLTR